MNITICTIRGYTLYLSNFGSVIPSLNYSSVVLELFSHIYVCYMKKSTLKY
jgi:hypothetical protein